ncbi:MAG: hypothetical protein RLP44_19180 [Aggregatilineales bacterium]
MATLTRPLIKLTGVLFIIGVALCLLMLDIGGRLPPLPQLSYTLPNESGYGTDIWLVDIQHRLHLRLTGHAASINNLVWSPDGEQLAYHVLNPGEHQLHIYTPSTGERVIFRSRPVFPSAPAWSPDSSRLALISDQDRGLFKLYIMDARTAQLTLLPTTGAPFDRAPVWSPDGGNIYFYSQDAQLQRGISRYDLRMGRAEVVRRYDERVSLLSPDVRRLMVIEDQSTYAVDDLTQAETSREAFSLNPHISDPPVSWSPDGNSLIFNSSYTGTSQLYRLTLADGIIHPLAEIFTVADFAWSPDGRTIAFMAVDVGQQNTYIIESDGYNLRQIVRALPHLQDIAWRGGGE